MARKKKNKKEEPIIPEIEEDFSPEDELEFLKSLIYNQPMQDMGSFSDDPIAMALRPFVLIDNELLLRKDFIIGIQKINNFNENIYSIALFYEALDDNPGEIWQKECFRRTNPKDRDVVFEKLIKELNGGMA